MSSVELTASHRPRTMSCTRWPPVIGCPPKVWGVLRWSATISLSSLRQPVKPGDTSVRGTAPSDEIRRIRSRWDETLKHSCKQRVDGM